MTSSGSAIHSTPPIAVARLACVESMKAKRACWSIAANGLHIISRTTVSLDFSRTSATV